MQFKLYDTLSRSLQPIPKPAINEPFRFYCCGPTVYGPAHIGNFRTFVVQDVFRRLLELLDYRPYHVRNITDVDDKTIRGAQAQATTLKAFTEEWTAYFQQDCKTLNLQPPHQEPKATEHIEELIQLIQQLIDKRHAYCLNHSVYFKLSSCPTYGKLAHLDLSALQVQERIKMNQADEYEREAIADFVLWKAYKPEDGDNHWDSPWGKGRPGWHSECCAMALKYLGKTLDLHAGGIDLCFPHHENEIAQMESVTGCKFAKHWFHVAHLMVENQKMSKSLGNLYTVANITEKGYTPLTLRYALFCGHYRSPLNFTFDTLKAAQSALARLQKWVHQLKDKSDKTITVDRETLHTFLNLNNQWFHSFWEKILEDFNIPAALGALFKTINNIDIELLDQQTSKQLYQQVYCVLFCLGLELLEHQTDVSKAHTSVSSIPEAIKALAEERIKAKVDKNFSKADLLRAEITSLGWQIVDLQDGTYQLQLHEQ
jgi:cysteinyl-tRNA synthetase